ncbi:DUF2239 family protein [Bordetella sp. 02P26C-1]|uniref:DUF2239 family protein n=1 Tax=Bordetella sp. 02P26C-1 TaxID=2683195 RepID=UPI0013549118|nr:DUF2239 family protein [Bordetella sp. 02P26C-1]MVW78820.1 DUF2239 family protein [Bordetella sp. 02P26C-1]
MDSSTGHGRDATTACTAFAGTRRLASGPLAEVALVVRGAQNSPGADRVVVFSDLTGEVLLDWRGTDEEIRRRLNTAQGGSLVQDAEPVSQQTPQPPRGRGRPKLGVVSREVTLLPKHWAWLAQQPGGTSVTLRTIIDRVLVTESDAAHERRRKEAGHRFLSALASDLPGFTEALRAVLALDRAQFLGHTSTWPSDIREHALRITFDEPA